MADVTEIDYTTEPPTITERSFTEAELEQIKKDIQEEEQRKKDVIAEAQAKAAQRQAILDRLGLTEEEAQLLLGGN